MLALSAVACGAEEDDGGTGGAEESDSAELSAEGAPDAADPDRPGGEIVLAVEQWPDGSTLTESSWCFYDMYDWTVIGR